MSQYFDDEQHKKNMPDLILFTELISPEILERKLREGLNQRPS